MTGHFTQYILISGRVQGVYYRASMQEQATALGLIGWCRNLPDGRVEAVAQGPLQQLEQLVVWCRQGPPHATVQEVQVKEAAQPIGPELNEFVIRR